MDTLDCVSGSLLPPGAGMCHPLSLMNYPRPGSTRALGGSDLTKTPTAASGDEPRGSDLPDGQFGQIWAQNTPHGS